MEDLTKHYGSVHALDGISFSAAPGEVFGLLGHNGAGKSTAIRVLTGSRPTDGTATVLGFDVVTDFEHIRKDINLVAESPTIYMRATAKENLDLFCRLYDVPKARADEALERVRLTQTGKQKVKDFSTGMKQRLLVARALLNAPRVLFLDEPTRGLDPQSARDLHGIVRELPRPILFVAASVLLVVSMVGFGLVLGLVTENANVINTYGVFLIFPLVGLAVAVMFVSSGIVATVLDLLPFSQATKLLVNGLAPEEPFDVSVVPWLVIAAWAVLGFAVLARYASRREV